MSNTLKDATEALRIGNNVHESRERVSTKRRTSRSLSELNAELENWRQSMRELHGLPPLESERDD